MRFTHPFPLFVKYYEDESLQGLAGRLMARQGYPDQGPLWRFIGLATRQLAPDTLEKLQFLSGFSREQLSALYSRTAKNGFVDVAGNLIASAKVSSIPTICLRCFAEAQYHRAIWDIKWLAACPKHGCLLTSKCPCGEPLRWQRPNFLECKKGHSLVAAAQNAREVDWGTRAEAAAYEISRFGSVQSSDLPPAIANLSLDVFIDVLNVIGGFGKRGYAELLKAGPHNFGRISQRLNQGYEQAMTWPASLRTFIQQHRSRGTRGGHTSVLRALKEVRRLKGTPAGEVLGDEWMSELVPEGGAEVPGAEEINLSQAAKRLGYSHFEMRLVNKVEGFAAKEGDFRLRFFSLAKFDDWVSQGKAWSKVQDVAARWMVENPALYDTCRLGVIGFDISATSLAFNTSPWRIRRYEIDEIEDLLTRPPEAVDGPGCSFSELRMPLYAVIQALRNEKLFACSWKPEHGLGHATFVAVERKPESTRARKSRLVDRFPRASVPSNSSNRRVALSSLVMHMGLGLGTLQRAWEGGFFGPTYGGPPPKDLDAMAVASFSALYVTSHLLVREGKAPSRNHVYEVLRRSKVRPANNPMKGTMSGSWHSTRFYRRSDLLSLDFTIDLK